MTIDKKTYEEMELFYGKDKIPNPKQWPLRFEFLVKSYLHHLDMKEKKKSVVKNEKL